MVIQSSVWYTVQETSSHTVWKNRPDNDVLTGGGVETRGGDLKVRESFPEDPWQWKAQVRNDHAFNNGEMKVWVMCLPK